MRLTHVLSTNAQILKLLSKVVSRQQKADKKSQGFRYQALSAALDASISEHGFCGAHVELVLKRAQGIAVTVSGISFTFAIAAVEMDIYYPLDLSRRIEISS
jgi:hypothetical protein